MALPGLLASAHAYASDANPLQNVVIEVERYKRQKCGGSDQLYYLRLKHLQHEEDWEIKAKITIVNGFWRETIFLWNKVCKLALTPLIFR